MKYNLSVPCLLGVEGLVSDELKSMGCEDVIAENGRVLFTGDMGTVARVNINLRYGERVQILVKSFKATSFEELFEQTKSVSWENYLDKNDEFPVSGSSLSSELHSIPDCQAIIKKAIVERLKTKYKISWFEETGPLHRIRFLIMKDIVSIMIDTSGEGLHKRGYRKNSTGAPIKETLAAVMAKLSRVRSDGNIIDPFCGSGTLLIEAAMLAKNIAPGINRKFSAEKWLNVPKKLWEQERERARDSVKRDASFKCTGYDIDPEAVSLTLENAEKAGVGAHIGAEQRDIKDFRSAEQYGCVLCNPPYGERLLDIKSAQEIYRTMGEVFEKKRGWNYTIISPDEDFERLYGRKADKRRKLYNGMIKCQLYMYFKW